MLSYLWGSHFRLSILISERPFQALVAHKLHNNTLLSTVSSSPPSTPNISTITPSSAMIRRLPSRIPIPPVQIVFRQEVMLTTSAVDLSRVWSHDVVIVPICGAARAVLVVVVGGGIRVGAGVDVIAWHGVLTESGTRVLSQGNALVLGGYWSVSIELES